MDHPFIRIKIFLAIGLCLGIPAVAWTLRLLLQHVRAGGRVSIFIIFLLLSDILELFLIPFLLASDLRCDQTLMIWEYGSCGSPITVVAFSGARLCGLCFHQLVALQSVLPLTHPRCFARLSSPFCSITICLTIWICTLTYLIYPLAFVVIGSILFAAAVVTCMLTIKVSCSCADPGGIHNIQKGTRLHIFVVAMGTLWLLYAPFVVWFCVWFNNRTLVLYIASMSVCMMSLRVIADPLQCVLVCREISQREPTQRGIQLNTVQTSN